MNYASPPNVKEFQSRVWEIARQVPAGVVTTYGQIASMIPPPGEMTLKDYDAFGPRWVGGAMANCPDDVPWQRVINSQGKISARPGAAKQKELLLGEGVQFTEKDAVDFDSYGWSGPDSEWCKAHSFYAPKPLGKPQLKLF